jgi:hypothetical protein
MNTLANITKNMIFRINSMGGIFALVFLFFVYISDGLSAQESSYQVDWSPNEYKLICSPPDSCLHSPDVHQKVEKLMPQVVNGIRGLKFKPPVWFGKRKGQGTAREYIELYETGDQTIARASPRCLPIGYENSFVDIGSQFTEFDDRDYLLYYFMAHEFFHVIQNEQPFFDPVNCANVPGWIKEGTATAVGQAAARKKYPGVFPEKRDERVARNFAGLRRYDKPLNHREVEDGEETKTGAEIYYRTSSFWRHLAEAHYKGRYDFLHKYMDRINSGGSWLNWLRANVQTGTGADLGMVFGGFLGDYAGWGDDGLPGQYYGRKKWLFSTFTGCETVNLNKVEALDYVEIDILPLAGKCIEVFISALGPNGIQEGESLAVQIAAMIMSGPPSSRGGVHLALAASNDKTNFHCAREVKRSRKKGVGKCLFIPDDGKIRLGGGSVDARVWNVVAQEKGDPEQMRQETETGARKGELKNLYTVSYTPTSISMRDTSHDSKDPITVRLYFILDVAKLEMEGNQKGAVGHFGEGGSDPQTTLPKQDAVGKRVNSYSKPDQFQPTIPMPAALPQQIQGKLGTIMVGTTAENAGSARNGVMLLPGKENSKGKVEPYALSVGETGSFPILVHASLDGEPVFGVEGGMLNVEEFNDLVFKARYSGTLCRLKDLIVEQESSEERCRNPFSMNGEIVKAFAGTRLAGQYMVTERTEGTEMYRKAGEQGMAQWSTPTTESADSENSGAPPGSGQSSGGQVPDCACTCEERNEMLSQGEAIAARHDAGEEVEAGALMGLMRCHDQCRPEYMSCVMEEDRKKKAEEEAEKAARELEQAKECDCSCTALNELQGRTEELLKAMQAGSPTAMDEMQRLGSCMSVCQSAMMSCAQSR